MNANNNFKMYNFIFKLFTTAILITFAVLLLVFKITIYGVIFLISGIIILFSALFRIVPLIKTLKTKSAKIVNIIEIISHILIGIYFLFAAFSHWSLDTPNDVNPNEFLESLKGTFEGFNLEAYRYFLIYIFTTRSFVYYLNTIIHKEDSTNTNFWLHSILMLLAVLFALIPFTPESIVYSLVVLSLICSIVVGGEAITGFNRYRKNISKKPEVEIDEEETPTIEVPAEDTDKEIDESNDTEEIEEINPEIIPVEDEIKDTAIIS